MDATSPTAPAARASGRVLFFETHPIQYRAPIFQALQRLVPGRFEVIYASDFSVRGTVDRDFGTTVSWDAPLLEGYPYRVLGNEGPGGGERFGGLTGKGVDRLIAEERPAAVVLHALHYRFSLAVYLSALRRGIPIWYRCDTNETAAGRSTARRLARWATYRTLYAGLSRALYVGELNRRHLLKFGLRPAQLSHVPHCVADRLADTPDPARQARRARTRERYGIAPEAYVVGFAGKLTPIKAPELIFDAAQALAPDVRARTHLLIVGSGPLADDLARRAEMLERAHGVRTSFAGFVNQRDIDDHYLAMDTLVLCSPHETWGLVVNEALVAGCAVAINDRVGCAPDFAAGERVRVTPQGDAAALAGALAELSRLPRDYHWADALVAPYSTKAVARALASLVTDRTDAP